MAPRRTTGKRSAVQCGVEPKVLFEADFFKAVFLLPQLSMAFPTFTLRGWEVT